MKLRNLVLTLHGSIGILIGLLLVVISLTGSAIVFHQELDRALNPSLMRVVPQAQQLSIDAILAPVQAAHPDLPLQFIRVPQTSEQTYQVTMTNPDGQRLETFVNPYTGEVLGSRTWERSLVGFLYTLHHQLFIGKVGEMIVGITGLLLLLIAITGIILWTGWRKLATGFKIRSQAPRQLLIYDIHKVGGILSSIFLLIIAFSGVFIVCFILLSQLNQTPKTEQALLTPQPSVALSELLSKADAAMPDGKTTFVMFSEHEPQKITVHKKLPQDSPRFALSSVELDRYRGEVLKVDKVVEPPPNFKILIAFGSLHFGLFGGLPTRILYVFIGLMPTVLLITGLVMWKRRRGLKARRKAALLLAKQTQENIIS